MYDLALDLRYLKSALEVAEQGSFRRAAGKLNLSQSTLSRRVQLLEDRLGVALFERSRVGARPTAAGKQFLRDAAISAEHLRRLVAEVSATRTGIRGELRLGLVTSFSQGPIADLLEAFQSCFPDVRITMEEGTSEASAAAVLNGRLDTAFVIGAPSPSGFGITPRIARHRIGWDNLLNPVGKGYGTTIATASSLGTKHAGVRFLPLAHSSETVSWNSIWRQNNKNPALARFIGLGSDLSRRNRR